MEKKSVLRRQALAGNVSAAGRHDMDQEICRRFLEAFPCDPRKILSFFWPLAKEADTRPIASACYQGGARCALPVITGGRGQALIFREWKPETPVVKSSFGTMEPFAGAATLVPDILLVPLVMVDLHGTRLGRGAGHYDATLAPLRAVKPVLAIGIAYDWQISEEPLPREDHDQRLDGLITPARFILFP